MDIRQQIFKLTSVLVNDVEDTNVVVKSVEELAEALTEICYYRGIYKNNEGFWYYDKELAPKRNDITANNKVEPIAINDITDDDDDDDEDQQ